MKFVFRELNRSEPQKQGLLNLADNYSSQNTDMVARAGEERRSLSPFDLGMQ
eukprot:CAMPEP_0202972594 /NCGR_PEP_ID=MMETSP1396-20130829/37778_1 /ASSEMBLY_ACC=CAM_ASM_000872 /TAXON_ID= /ORGANISM="Pseudokeronopsis sp., Strain Brazil" /LENGTH=51 /DNA_ID=CAMNT_0049703159 /DNA_START=24 /DNA_END=176 /DNA_ORIENTATION=+